MALLRLASAHKRAAEKVYDFEIPQKRLRIEDPNIQKNEEIQTVCPLASCVHADEFGLSSADGISNWKQMRENLKVLTFDGEDVAVCISPKDSFFLDLPFLDCVLPSMQAGEPYFVPAFIQNILLPFWKYGSDSFLSYERAIINLTAKDFYPSLTEYLELLFLAAALEIEYPLDAVKLSSSQTITRLEDLIRGLFGVGFLNKFTEGDMVYEMVKTKLAIKAKQIPSILMTGQQWGFDARTVASNISKMGCFNLEWLERIHLPFEYHANYFIQSVVNGALLPSMQEATVKWIAWTMNPEFVHDFNLGTGKLIFLPKNRYEIKRTPRVSLSKSSSRQRHRRPTLEGILRVLEEKEIQRNPNYVPLVPDVTSLSALKAYPSTKTPKRAKNANPKKASTTRIKKTNVPLEMAEMKSILSETTSRHLIPVHSAPSPQMNIAPCCEKTEDDSIYTLSGLSEFSDDPLNLFSLNEEYNTLFGLKGSIDDFESDVFDQISSFNFS